LARHSSAAIWFIAVPDFHTRGFTPSLTGTGCPKPNEASSCLNNWWVSRVLIQHSKSWRKPFKGLAKRKTLSVNEKDKVFDAFNDRCSHQNGFRNENERIDVFTLFFQGSTPYV